MDRSKAILESWAANARAWEKTVEGQEIESRKLVTDQAIIETIVWYPVQKIVDIGCGEGWLTRALRDKKMDSYGVDAIPSLVQAAIEKGGPWYKVGTYSQVAEGVILPAGYYDAAVINFALIDKDDTDSLMMQISDILAQGGFLFIQTLHPFTASEGTPYVTGWRDGSWQGMRQDFVLPYEWYFRTLTDWIQLFVKASLTIREIKEPLHPVSLKPASIIFVLQNN